MWGNRCSNCYWPRVEVWFKWLKERVWWGEIRWILDRKLCILPCFQETLSYYACVSIGDKLGDDRGDARVEILTSCWAGFGGLRGFLDFKRQILPYRCDLLHFIFFRVTWYRIQSHVDDFSFLASIGKHNKGWWRLGRPRQKWLQRWYPLEELCIQLQLVSNFEIHISWKSVSLKSKTGVEILLKITTTPNNMTPLKVR